MSAAATVNRISGVGFGPAGPSTKGTNGDSGCPKAEDAPADASGRDAQGRFAKGWKGGPGNPFARRSVALRKRVQDKLTDAQLDQIVDCLIAQAKEGDVAAAKLLLAYGIGKPTDGADPDTLDVEEWQRFREQAVPAGEVTTTLAHMPAQLVCKVLAATLPHTAAKQASAMATFLRNSGPTQDDTPAQPRKARQARQEPRSPDSESRTTRPARQTRRAGKTAPAPLTNGSNGIEQPQRDPDAGVAR